MPAVASTIFKIKAIADFVAPDKSGMLSFRKEQPFYALAADHDRGVFFVSTQFATPFARTAVSGMVPITHFVKVDLHPRDPPRAAPRMPTHPDWAAAAASRVVVAELVPPSKVPDAPADVLFHIKVAREACAHSVVRSVPDLIALHRAVTIQYAAILKVPDLPFLELSAAELASHQTVTQIEQYINILISISNTTNTNNQQSPIAAFFAPRDEKELATILLHPNLRRDSGVSEAYSDKENSDKDGSRRRTASMSSTTSTSSNQAVPTFNAATTITAPIPAVARKDIVSWVADPSAFNQATYPQRMQNAYAQPSFPARHNTIPGHAPSMQSTSPSSLTATNQPIVPQRKRSIASEFFHQLFGSTTQTASRPH